MNAGDPLHLSCGGPLQLHKTIEIGHMFKLGYKYSDTMGLRVLAANGAEVTPIMGSYQDRHRAHFDLLGGTES